MYSFFQILFTIQKGTLAHELELRSKLHEYMGSINIINIFLQICEGVKAFHEAKPEPLAHRDLKTANIVLDDGMIPVIMDLGKINNRYFNVSLHRTQIVPIHLIVS